MLTNPFHTAERYIQLRKRCLSPSWGDRVILFNEMVVGPLIGMFLLSMGSTDYIMVISAIMRAYSAWCDWEEYHVLKSVMQDMFLTMTMKGGPYIRTNDPTYFPYVIADAMVRLSQPHPLQSYGGSRQEPLQGTTNKTHMFDFLAFLTPLQ